MTLIARSAAWHADRRGGIGSSDAPIITGDSPWGDLLTLYAVKAGIVDEPDNGNQETDWGLRLERTVAEWYEEDSVKRGTPRKVRRVNRRMRHKQHAWMHASLDRKVVGEDRIVEIKTRRFADDEWGPTGTAQIPAHYLVQVQHQLAVTGYPVADVAVLFSGSDPRLYTVERDDTLIAALIELEAEFWACVTNGTKPEALIRKQRPVIAFREGEITADETLARGIEGLFHLRQEIKGLKADEEAAADAVKTILGPNVAARAGDFRATYKQNADSHPVRWDLVAAAYRKFIASIDPEWDADVIEGLFTDTKPGFRPLLIKKVEDAANAA